MIQPCSAGGRRPGPLPGVLSCGPVSGCGHQVTTHGAIRMTRLDQDVVAVSGTPVDCVRLALTALCPRRPGSSRESTREATWEPTCTSPARWPPLARRRSTASRQSPCRITSSPRARRRLVTGAAEWTGRVLQRLLAFPCRPGTFWNENLPHLPAEVDEPGAVFCPLDPSPLPVTYRIEDDARRRYR